VEVESHSKECISGNCYTGYGTVFFRGGNKYEGNFLKRRRQGKGIFYFASGDVLNGNFENDQVTDGTYRFNNRYSYTGNWGADGLMKTGTYYAPTGTSVEMINGKVIASLISEVVKNATTRTSRPAVKRYNAHFARVKQ